MDNFKIKKNRFFYFLIFSILLMASIPFHAQAANPITNLYNKKIRIPRNQKKLADHLAEKEKIQLNLDKAKKQTATATAQEKKVKRILERSIQEPGGMESAKTGRLLDVHTKAEKDLRIRQGSLKYRENEAKKTDERIEHYQRKLKKMEVE